MEPTRAAPAVDRPGVVALPPLIYLAALLVALVLNVIVPLRLELRPPGRWAGAGLMAVAIAFGVLARVSFARARTPANPMESTTTLVTSGVFRWSRNPMYVGMTTLLIGAGLLTRVAWILILLPPVLAIMHWGVVVREERYLVRRFGAEYDAYRSRVRRYL